jgi:hypothetical protein
MCTYFASSFPYMHAIYIYVYIYISYIRTHTHIHMMCHVHVLCLVFSHICTLKFIQSLRLHNAGMYVHVYVMYVCMYACMCAIPHLHTGINSNMYMHAWVVRSQGDPYLVCGSMYVCVHVCMYVCMHICVHVCTVFAASFSTYACLISHHFLRLHARQFRISSSGFKVTKYCPHQ